MVIGVFRLFCLVLAVSGAGVPAAAQDNDAVTQYSTLDALSGGLYDGDMTVDEMAGYGDLGLGTFDRLDGEMIVVDGVFWRARHDGSLDIAPPETETPFAAVTPFEVDDELALPDGLDMAGLAAILSERIGASNTPIAVRIDGTFRSLTYRAPARQDEPYPPLVEALTSQAVWTVNHVEMTLVGFWYPPWLAGINAPVWHLHAVSKDRTFGGHVLDLVTDMGVVSLDRSPTVTVIMPTSPAFEGLDLATP
ncbi:MAG: acetolactate decarboxylase [Pseudomonadota bacterium]